MSLGHRRERGESTALYQGPKRAVLGSGREDPRRRRALLAANFGSRDQARRGGGRPLAPDQPWQDIRGIGNHLRHGYDSLDIGMIWEAVEGCAALAADSD